MIDVLMLCINDWANTGWRFSQALQHIGLDVLFLKGVMHKFMYPEQGIIHPDIVKAHLAQKPEGGEALYYSVPELNELARSANVIHFRDTCIIDTGVDLEKKWVIAQHGGRIYRQHNRKVNREFNQFVDATIIQCPDLWGLGAKNEHLIYYPVDTNRIKPVYEPQDDRLIIGHFPSMPTWKGTSVIYETILKIGKEHPRLAEKFAYFGPTHEDLNNDPNKWMWLTIWSNHLKRIAMCDILIETVSKTAQDDLPYGEWGNQALEAAAMGKIVITNTLTADLYRKEYGPGCALHVANDATELEAQLIKILNMGGDEMMEHRYKSREWVEKYHSIEKTGERLWEKIYKHLKPKG